MFGSTAVASVSPSTSLKGPCRTEPDVRIALTGEAGPSSSKGTEATTSPAPYQTMKHSATALPLRMQVKQILKVTSMALTAVTGSKPRDRHWQTRILRRRRHTCVVWHGTQARLTASGTSPHLPPQPATGDDRW